MTRRSLLAGPGDGGWPTSLAGDGGYLLLEVLVAVILVGIVVGPLATSLAGQLSRARDAQSTSSVAGRSQAAQSVSEEDWGPRVVDAWWRPGPVLHVRTSETTGGNGIARLGVWVDGWLVAEVVADPAGLGGAGGSGQAEISVQPSVFSAHAGGALVIRVRSGAGPWGPPWRTEVPPGSGIVPVPVPLAASDGPPPGVVVHRRGIASSPLGVSWSAVKISSPSFGLLFAETAPFTGWGTANLDGRTQTWQMEEGRSVDLYY